MEKFDTWIEWIEPFGPNNEPVYCRVSTDTAIATQKSIVEKTKKGFRYKSDADALADFVIAHWAKIYQEKPRHTLKLHRAGAKE